MNEKNKWERPIIEHVNIVDITNADGGTGNDSMGEES